jgi:hypothetical protein
VREIELLISLNKDEKIEKITINTIWTKRKIRKKPSVSGIRTTFLQHGKRALYPLDQRKTKSEQPNFFFLKKILQQQNVCCVAPTSQAA